MNNDQERTEGEKITNTNTNSIFPISITDTTDTTTSTSTEIAVAQIATKLPPQEQNHNSDQQLEKKKPSSTHVIQLHPSTNTTRDHKTSSSKTTKEERRAIQEKQRMKKALAKIALQTKENKAQPYLLGAIIGDIVGSRFEHSRQKLYDFDLITHKCRFTDDSVLTVAVADAIMNQQPYDETIRKWSKKYPKAGYGGTFRKWMYDDNMGSYNSWGNGSAMRVSPCGYLNTLEEVLEESKKSAMCTHNHVEGIKGAQATATCIYLARNGKSKEEIKEFITNMFGYDLDRTIAEIRPTYTFDVSCQGSVPESIIAFLESRDYEDSIRLAISLGGDTDTQAAIAGSIAQAFYKEIPLDLEINARSKLSEDLISIIDSFNSKLNKLV